MIDFEAFLREYTSKDEAYVICETDDEAIELLSEAGKYGFFWNENLYRDKSPTEYYRDHLRGRLDPAIRFHFYLKESQVARKNQIRYSRAKDSFYQVPQRVPLFSDLWEDTEEWEISSLDTLL